LAARNGRKLKTLAICRISTVNQDERSLADQEAVYRERIAQHTDLPFGMDVIASQGSGECLDRVEYLRSAAPPGGLTYQEVAHDRKRKATAFKPVSRLPTCQVR
jgi:hypothetical protein